MNAITRWWKRHRHQSLLTPTERDFIEKAITGMEPFFTYAEDATFMNGSSLDDKGHPHRHCFQCGRDLWFSEALNSNTGMDAQLAAMWDDPIFEILCCSCYRHATGTSMGDEMEALAIAFLRGERASEIIFDEATDIERRGLL